MSFYYELQFYMYIHKKKFNFVQNFNHFYKLMQDIRSIYSLHRPFHKPLKTTKWIKYSLLIPVACMFLNLHAGEIILRKIPVAKELPSNTVYRMFQDKDGFVWFGTMNGFCRFDGHCMKSFRSKNAGTTFPSNYITGGFAEDTLNHTLWIGTEKGVLILDEYTLSITVLDMALLGESLIRQILYTDSTMWVCSDFGLYLYNLDKTLKKKYLAGANSIHIDTEGAIRVTAWNEGMYYLDKANDIFVAYPKIGSGNNPHKIFQDNTGHLWICTWGDGLYRFYPDRYGKNMYEHMNMPHDKNFNVENFYGIIQDDFNGYFWTLSYSGVTVFKPDGNCIVPIDEFTSPINDLTNIFSDIIKDRDGNLWLGTYEQGAIIVNPCRSSITNLNLQFIKAKTDYIPNILRIFEDKDDELWIRQDRLGIFLFNSKTSAIKPVDIPDIRFANAICDNSYTNEIWVAVDYDPYIYRLRKSGGKVSLTGMINLNNIFDDNAQIVKFLHEDRNGVVWAATNNTLLSWKQNKWQLVNSDCGTITGITEDSYGAIWISSIENGLLQIIPDGDQLNFKKFNTYTSEIEGNNITCVCSGEDGELWFCVNENRLYNYDIANQQFTDYTQIVNPNNFVIFSIIVGNNEHIWFSSDKQIVEFNPTTGASMQYDTQNDLIITSLNKNSIIKTRNGSIIFGGNKGLCILSFSPQLEALCKKVEALITDIKINGNSVYQRDLSSQNLHWRKKLILLPNETNLEFNFSSFNYLNSGKTRYAYMLKGVDNQWIYPEPGRNFAIYNQLRKGEYTFLIKSTGDNQLWSDKITRLIIIRKPAFYETNWAYSVYAVITGLILFAGLRFYINRIRLRNELQIAQIDKEKSEELIQTKLGFFTNIGHEFRTPLTLIMTPLSRLIHQSTDENLKQKLTSIYRNAEDMLGLINQLLDFRKLEMGGENLKVSCNDFVKFAEYIYLSFKDLAENKSILFTFESDVKQLFMGFDKSKVRKTINNLYSNAMKFTPAEGYIATTIKLIQEDGREFVRLSILDSGCGISENEQQTIFNRFYQSESNNLDTTGSGIGLHLAKEYVELHGGYITVSSKPGKGSAFSISIPADLQVSGDNAKMEDSPSTEPSLLFETEINRMQEQKILLIVEDNVELRHFLAEQLGDKFNVLQAADGKQGADIALRKLPDLIVSDLMMPIVNGLELCQSLKTDIQTSHIPIILLTAKLSDETKIESYKAGADSYIAKPFNYEVLLARIEMFIEQQEKRKKLFYKTIEITPSSITTTSLDEALIKKALLAAEKNMDNSEYSVDELASELALSRRQLSRKFQSIIGLTPSEFICSIRLKRAAQLLKDSQYNISEISDIVGFSTIRSFNQNFKDEFGLTPTQYRAKRMGSKIMYADI